MKGIKLFILILFLLTVRFETSAQWVNVNFSIKYKALGEHKVTFKAAGMPPGIYFYQIKTGSVVETRKMVLIK